MSATLIQLAALLVAAALGVAVDDYQSAQAQALAADNHYREALLAMLGSKNVYARHQALLRLEAQPAWAGAKVQEAVLELIDDEVPVYPPECQGAEERYRHSKGQGEIYDAALCMHYRQQHNSVLAQRVLARAMPDPKLLELLLARALATRQPTVHSDPDPVTEVLRQAKSVPAQPFLDRLASPLDPVQRGFILAYALLIRGQEPIALAGTPLPGLLADPDLRTRCRAGMVVLLLSAESDPLRHRAISTIQAGLLGPEGPSSLGEAIAADLVQIGAAAAPLVDALSQRTRTKGVYRGWTFGALAQLGPLGAAALPAAIDRISCREVECLEEQPVRFIAALGMRGRPATSALIAAAARNPFQLNVLSSALEAIDARPSKAEWQQLEATYANACRDAGSIPFFSLSRDDSCAEVAGHLGRIAKRSGLTFREVGWQ